MMQVPQHQARTSSLFATCWAVQSGFKLISCFPLGSQKTSGQVSSGLVNTAGWCADGGLVVLNSKIVIPPCMLPRLNRLRAPKAEQNQTFKTNQLDVMTVVTVVSTSLFWASPATSWVESDSFIFSSSSDIVESRLTSIISAPCQQGETVNFSAPTSWAWLKTHVAEL